MNPQVLEDLKAPFPPKLIQRKGTGRQDDYVNHAVVTDRLNRVVPDWNFSIVHIETYVGKDSKPHVAGITGVMTIGDSKREDAGDVEREESYGNELKNAVSDCIKRCAMRFGVAIQLWHEIEDSDPAGQPAAREGTQEPTGSEHTSGAAPEPRSRTKRNRAEAAAPESSPAPSDTQGEGGTEPGGDAASMVEGPSDAATPSGAGDTKEALWTEFVRLYMDAELKPMVVLARALNRALKASEVPEGLSEDDLRTAIAYVKSGEAA